MKQRNFKIIVSFLTIVYFLICGLACSEKDSTPKKDDSIMASSEAKTICMNAFESSSKYEGADASMFDTIAMESKKEKYGDVWLVKVPGTMKNAYGTDVKAICHCTIPLKKIDNSLYSKNNIVEFTCQ